MTRRGAMKKVVQKASFAASRETRSLLHSLMVSPKSEPACPILTRVSKTRTKKSGETAEEFSDWWETTGYSCRVEGVPFRNLQCVSDGKPGTDVALQWFAAKGGFN